MKNFWIEDKTSGNKSPLRGGPRTRSGGFYLQINARDHGCSRKALTVEGMCHTNENKEEILRIYVNGDIVWESIR